VVVRATILLLVAIGIATAKALGVRVDELARFYVVWSLVAAVVNPLGLLVVALATGHARWPLL
jgi:hypothetical protein